MSVTHMYQGRRVLLHSLPHPISEVRIIRQSGSSRQAIVKISPLFELKYSEKLQRKIDQADVELVLAYPDRIEPSGEGRISAYKMLGERLLKVTYFQEQNLIKVITAVWKGE